jgi:hypothetical protein
VRSRHALQRAREAALAALMAAAFMAGWAWLAEATWTTPPDARTAPHVTRLTHWPDAAEGPGAMAWDRDPRALWSPVLFALPTAVGFSAPRQPGEQAAAAPWLASRDGGGLLLQWLPSAPPPVPALQPRTRAEVDEALANRWTRVPRPGDPFSSAPVTGAVLHLEWPDGAPDLAGPVPDLLSPPAAPDERGWELAATLYVSERGDVQGVFLEPNNVPRERAEQVVRQLRRIRLNPGRAQQVRIALMLQRPALVRADRAGEAP